MKQGALVRIEDPATLFVDIDRLSTPAIAIDQNEGRSGGTSLLFRDVSVKTPGRHLIEASDGASS